MTTHGPTLLLVIGSTRPVRVGDQLAEAIAPILAAEGADVRVADLADLDLPLLNEPVMAARGSYAHGHTREWSALVQTSDIVVWLTPQYNGGYPASLKNAIDYLFHEWKDKPTFIISYGGHGGGLGGAQLRSVLDFIRMHVVAPNVEITLSPQGSYGPDGRLEDPGSEVVGATAALQSATRDAIQALQPAADPRQSALAGKTAP